MDDRTETLWRKALQVKGKDWVLAEMRRRPGQPGDVVLDVVYQDPLPTRAFCMQWCAEEDNKIIRFTWQKVAIGFAIILLVVCMIKGIQSRDDAVRQLAGQSSHSAPTASAGARNHSKGMSNGNSTNANAASVTVPNPATSSTGSTGTSSSNSSSPVPSVCAYLTYPTAQCGNSTLARSGSATSSNSMQTTGSAYPSRPAAPSPMQSQ